MSTTLKDQSTAIAGVYKITQPKKTTINLLNDIIDEVDGLLDEVDRNGITEEFKVEYAKALSKLLYIGNYHGFDLEQMLGNALMHEINTFKKANKL